MTTQTDPPIDPESRGLRLVPTLLSLTVVSGLIDAVSYLGLGHVFTANMTGNVVVLGFAAAGAPGFSVPHTLTSLCCFVAGAATGGRTSVRLGAGPRRTWARATFAAEALLTAACAAVAFAAPHATATTYTVIAVTAFAMGLRNATVRRLRRRGPSLPAPDRLRTGDGGGRPARRVAGPAPGAGAPPADRRTGPGDPGGNGLGPRVKTTTHP